MSDTIKLTKEDLYSFKTDRKEAIKLIRYYAAQYESKVHYDELGPSCVASATKTVDTIIGSSYYLQGYFIMPDEINVERLVRWFRKNRDYDFEKSVITFYFSIYIKRKINQLYKDINNNRLGTSVVIAGTTLKEFERECNVRNQEGVKLIR
ncbi:hypothetical protein GCM10011351_26860 [Paraliobacillus quinghaiensis]|uniref:Uncharacterized protein n=1 Tax=Paraliobacillus quinghaiensis TaxID=470815 RepID=A0A917WXJ9_9BACI|nr:hypothetical protein [Paraliobacillus quinghaiensis]GGM39336.1 hypothetical protein GCM10011351_26860 [Paraliobacillus quinghaiensis]